MMTFQLGNRPLLR
uniref:Uncharacterized protein n=1 Tax=Phlebotomus papatasi TaxID=29031 RepID=A0A1B0DHG7_PHLPP